ENVKTAGDSTASIGTHWLASVDFDRFQLKKLSGWTFEIGDAFWDFSDLNNPPGMQFPENYSQTDSSFQGIYIQNAFIKAPLKMVASGLETDRASVEINNLIIDPEFYMDVQANNILSLG